MFKSFQLTWADIVFVAAVDYFKFIASVDLTEGQENLKKVVENVSNVPAIKAWFDKRPQTAL